MLHHNQTPQVIADTVIGAAANYTVVMQGAEHVSFQVNAEVNSTAKTADAGIVASKVIQDITYTAVGLTSGLDSAGNDITIEYVAGGTAGAEVVTVTGSAISISIDDGVSTATQVKAAFDAKAEAVALASATISGTAGTAQVAVAATNLEGGVDSEFVVSNDTISIPSHGYFTGQVIQVTKSGSNFPTGISGSTDYFVYKVDANTIQLFDTLAHALAAVPAVGSSRVSESDGLIDITADGSKSSTMTLTPTAISGVSYKIQKSNDFVDSVYPNVNNGGTANNSGNWIDAVSGETYTVVTNNITTTANSSASIHHAPYHAVRVLFAISAGTVKIKVIAQKK